MVITLDPPRQTDLKQSKYALYVEDERLMREMITGLIKDVGYEVMEADNLQDAMNHARRRKFDVYIADGFFHQHLVDQKLPV